MRLGRFNITPELLHYSDLEGLVRIFADCALVPIRIRELGDGVATPRIVEYTCYSPHFDHIDSLKEGEKPPLYVIDIWSERRAGIFLR